MTELRQRMIRGQNERVEEPGDVKCVAVETDLDSVAGIASPTSFQTGKILSSGVTQNRPYVATSKPANEKSR
jgi:hypothetical protein